MTAHFAIAEYALGGVIFNNVLYSAFNLAGTCGSNVGSPGDGSIVVVTESLDPWDNPSTLGTADAGGQANLYLEGNTFQYIGQIPDVDSGGRVVIRYNQITDIAGGLTHGTTSLTGGRQYEIYANNYTRALNNFNLSRWWWSRGGTGLMTDNVIANPAIGSCYISHLSIHFR